MTKYTTEQIQEAAYYIWQNEGCPMGMEEAHWLKAVNQLNSTKTTTAKKATTKRKTATKKATTAKKTTAKKATTTKKTTAKKATTATKKTTTKKVSAA
jgi:sRNA-binding protein